MSHPENKEVHMFHIYLQLRQVSHLKIQPACVLMPIILPSAGPLEHTSIKPMPGDAGVLMSGPVMSADPPGGQRLRRRKKAWRHSALSAG